MMRANSRASPLLPVYPGQLGKKARRRLCKRLALIVATLLVVVYCLTSFLGSSKSGTAVNGQPTAKRSLAETLRGRAPTLKPFRSAHVLDNHATPQLNLDTAHLQEHADHGPDKQQAAAPHDPGSDEPCTPECEKDHVHTYADGTTSSNAHHLPGDDQRAVGSLPNGNAIVHKPVGTGLYSMNVRNIDGEERSLSEFANKVVLVVNVASQCGYTASNYAGLQRLYEKYSPKGFEVLAFPCNQFGAQEPGDAASIKDFAKNKYHITFPIFTKIEVNGPNQHPIFGFLKRELPVAAGGGGGAVAGTDIDWNFNKYLVNRKGFPVQHYKSAMDEAVLEADIQKELELQVVRP